MAGTSPAMTADGSRIIRALARGRWRARPQPLHHHREKGEHAKRRQCADKLRRERGVHVELEPAIGAARRQAGLIGGLLRREHAVEALAYESKYEERGNAA